MKKEELREKEDEKRKEEEEGEKQKEEEGEAKYLANAHSVVYDTKKEVAEEGEVTNVYQQRPHISPGSARSRQYSKSQVPTNINGFFRHQQASIFNHCLTPEQDAINPFEESGLLPGQVCKSHQQIVGSLNLLLLPAESGLDGSINQRIVAPSLLAAEKEEAKAVLTLFLKNQGLSNAVANRVINKSDAFVDHLVLRLHSVHKLRYLVGRELTTLEIRDALIPYLKTLLEEYGGILVQVVENFPHPPPLEEISLPTTHTPPAKESSVRVDCPPTGVLDSKKRRALARVSEISLSTLPPHVTYLIGLGMELDTIREIIRKFPAFSYYTLEGKIKPVVEFLLDLGVSQSDIPIIITKRPQLCGISLSENIIPTMTFLENLGVDKTQWAKVIYRFPALLTYSHQKLKGTVDFLYEMGLSAENVGKVLTRCPNIISYSVEDKLRPTADYFCSLGINVALLLLRAPQAFGLSIETNLKPATAFFLERGYSMGEVRTMISRYGVLYTFSLAKNLVPKWEYFLTMGYPKAELVKFPQYFGYSLEVRIKPRYAIVRKNDVKLLLNQVLSLSDVEFTKALERKIRQKCDK